MLVAALSIGFVSCGGTDDPKPTPTDPKAAGTYPPGEGELGFTAEGLTPGTTYYWKVVARDDRGGSATSEVRSFTVRE